MPGGNQTFSCTLGPESGVLKERGTKGMDEGHGHRLDSRAGSKVSGLMFLGCSALALTGKAPGSGALTLDSATR